MCAKTLEQLVGLSRYQSLTGLWRLLIVERTLKWKLEVLGWEPYLMQKKKKKLNSSQSDIPQ
jgi:hypothetical protein